MHYILDGAVIIVLLLCIIKSWKKGLVSSLINFIGTIAALAGAWVISGMIADWAYMEFIHKSLVDNVSQQMAGGAAAISGWLAGLLSSQQSANSAETIVANALRSPVTSIVRLVLFVLLFILLLVIIGLIEKATKKVNKVPLLGFANRVGGGVFGLLKGLIVCYLIVTAASLLIRFTGDEMPWLNTNVIANTRFFSALYHFDPVDAILNSGMLG